MPPSTSEGATRDVYSHSVRGRVPSGPSGKREGLSRALHAENGKEIAFDPLGSLPDEGPGSEGVR
jgi:hypothetical protein